MKGFYFINTDVRNTRAHTSQILNTAAAINGSISLSVVAPRYYGVIKLEDIKNRHGLGILPKLIFLKNFSVKDPSVFAFALFNIPAIGFLFLKLIREEIDFIYIRSSIFFPLAIFAYIFQIPCYYETHRKPLSFHERYRDYVMSRISTGIIVISNYLKEYYLPYKKNILIVHDAVSLERFSGVFNKGKVRKDLGILPGDKVCLYAGTVSRLKGVDYIFVTAKILPDFVFLLVGPALGEFVGINVPKNVKLLGAREQSELPPILHCADVLLLPHPKGEYSQSPMKLFEYMASGVPIVASRLPSISEVLNNNNAILIEAENANALASGIQKVVNDKSFSDKISKQAYQDVRSYTWEERGRKIATFIISRISYH